MLFPELSNETDFPSDLLFPEVSENNLFLQLGDTPDFDSLDQFVVPGECTFPEVERMLLGSRSRSEFEFLSQEDASLTPFDAVPTDCDLVNDTFNQECGQLVQLREPTTPPRFLSPEEDLALLLLFTPPVLRAYRKFGRRCQYNEKTSNVSFSSQNKIGKRRKFSLTQCSPDVSTIRVQFISSAAPSLGLSLLDEGNHCNSEQRPLEISPVRGEGSFFVFPTDTSPKANATEHILLLEFFASSGSLLFSHCLSGMYSAGHKHESSKTQSKFHQETNTEAVLDFTGLRIQQATMHL